MDLIFGYTFLAIGIILLYTRGMLILIDGFNLMEDTIKLFKTIIIIVLSILLIN